jgi:protein TonB
MHIDTTKKPPLPLNGQDVDAPVVDNSKIFTWVEEMPAYPGGRDSLYSYLAQHIVYPPIALDAKIGGYVHITFVVEKDGSLTEISVSTKTNGRLNGEALRVVSAMKLTPARHKGQLVRVASDIIIHFDPANPQRFD